MERSGTSLQHNATGTGAIGATGSGSGHGDTKMKTAQKLTIRKGTVRYWSIYQQRWVQSDPAGIPDEELAAMPDSDRRRVIKARA